MPKATFTFPSGFLWGSATAAHQVEGNNTNNNWYAWEQTPGKIKLGHKSGLACDWWGGRWKEDLDRAAETGQNAHRFSVEWSRIQPSPDRWDEDALDHYRQMARGMIERGIRPMLTLHHFSDPLWLSEQGAWENDETPAKFAEFTRRVVEALKEYVKLWITINEPNIYTFNGYLLGQFPPGKVSFGAAFEVMRNMVRGHAAAYRIIHQLQKEARVGFSHNHHPLTPDRRWMPLDGLVTAIAHQVSNNAFAGALATGTLNFIVKRARIPEAVGTQDYFGVNYYTSDRIAVVPNPQKTFLDFRYPAGTPMSENKFIAHLPAGLFTTLKWARRFKLPIIITENGVEDSRDVLRPRYLAEHLHQVWRAANFNWQIQGYIHWSLVDNFEWERGWTQRFGLWGLDTETQARTRRPSADLYAEICRSNSLSSDMVQRYCPEAFDAMFPV